MTNWNKVKKNLHKVSLPKYREQEVVYALMRSHDYYEHRRKNEAVPLSLHSVFKYRFEAEREMEVRNDLAVSDYWWVKPVVMVWGRVL